MPLIIKKYNTFNKFLGYDIFLKKVNENVEIIIFDLFYYEKYR